MLRDENSPRVALVGSSLKLAGAEKQTVYIARALHEAGMDARFFHLGESGYYENTLHRMGIPFRQIYRPNKPVFILTRLAKALWRFQPQIVFAPQFGDLLQAGLAGRLCNALTLGGLRSDGFYELNTHGRWSRWMLRLAHGLVANSYHARQNLASCGLNPEKMKILPNVLDLREFDARSREPSPFALSSNQVFAVAVGSLLACKRFDRFLNALALARRKAPNLVGVIVGADCGCRATLEVQAKELRLTQDHFVFLGECDNVPALLARAGFLVLSSDYEGFPNVILEAMAARLPVITTPVGDAERIVVQGRTGFLVNSEDIEAMANRMVELARSPVTRMRLGTEARRRVAREYNYDSLPSRLLSVFRRFAAQNHRSKLVEDLREEIPAGQSSVLSGALVLGGAAG